VWVSTARASSAFGGSLKLEGVGRMNGISPRTSGTTSRTNETASRRSAKVDREVAETRRKSPQPDE